MWGISIFIRFAGLAVTTVRRVEALIVYGCPGRGPGMNGYAFVCGIRYQDSSGSTTGALVILPSASKM